MSGVVLRSAVEMLAMLDARKISPLELAEEHIRQIDRLNPQLNALIDFDADRVRAQAAALDPSREGAWNARRPSHVGESLDLRSGTPVRDW